MRPTVAIFTAVILMALVNYTHAGDDSERGKLTERPRKGRSEMGGDKQTDMEERRGRGPGAHGEHSLIDRFISNPNIIKKLELSDEQVSELKRVSKESKAKLQELSKAMQEAGKQQAEQITADNIDEKAVMEAVERAGKIRTEMAKVHASQILMLNKFLTSEQREQVKEIMSHRKEGRNRGDDRGEEDGEGFRKPKDRESGEADMERRREEMKEKMMERRKQKMRELQKENKEESDS